MARIVFRGKKMYAAIIAIAFLVLIYYFVHDLNLRPAIDLANLPDLVVESLRFSREIDGKDWNVSLQRAEHKSGIISAEVLSVEAEELSGDQSLRLHAESGMYDSDTGGMDLASVEGSISYGERSLDWRSSKAEYSSSTDIWTLSGGVAVRDNLISISADRAKISEGSIFTMEGGAEARWIPER